MSDDQWAIDLPVGEIVEIKGTFSPPNDRYRKLAAIRTVDGSDKTCPVCGRSWLTPWAGWWTCDFSPDHCVGLVGSGVMFERVKGESAYKDVDGVFVSSTVRDVA